MSRISPLSLRSAACFACGRGDCPILWLSAFGLDCSTLALCPLPYPLPSAYGLLARRLLAGDWPLLSLAGLYPLAFLPYRLTAVGFWPLAVFCQVLPNLDNHDLTKKTLTRLWGHLLCYNIKNRGRFRSCYVIIYAHFYPIG